MPDIVYSVIYALVGRSYTSYDSHSITRVPPSHFGIEDSRGCVDVTPCVI
jgi:hypothetical protein